jgi:hypothetical protein
MTATMPTLYATDETCPTCHGSVEASDDLIPGTTILRCRPCATLAIRGDTKWFDGHAVRLDALRERAALLAAGAAPTEGEDGP